MTAPGLSVNYDVCRDAELRQVDMSGRNCSLNVAADAGNSASKTGSWRCPHKFTSELLRNY